MAVYFKTGTYFFEVGTSDFLISFFDTIEYRLTRGFFSKKYPAISEELYNGKLAFDKLDQAETELRDIQKRLRKLDPTNVIWDKNDLTRKPPWGDDISKDITDMSNYFVTSDGKDLIEVLFKAITTAKIEGSELIIE